MKYALALIVCLLSFTGTAFATSTAVAAADVSSDGTLLDLAKPVLDAVRSGNGWLAAALALVLLVGAVRKWLAPRKGKWDWLNGSAGGAVCNVLLSFGGMVATALAAGTLPSWGLAFTAIKVSIAAAGGFTLIKELAAPFLRWVEAKLPAWAQPWAAPVFTLLCSLFEKPGEAAIAKSKAAGQAAVQAKPPAGVNGVLGAPEDLR